MSSDESGVNEQNDDDREATGAVSSLGGVPRANGGGGGLTSTDLAMLGHAMRTEDSTLLQRYAVARNAGLAFEGDRDYYEVLGYDRDPDPEDYYAAYLRNDIARRIVDAKPNATWSERPHVVDDANEGTSEEPETEFEQAVEYLFDEHRLLHYLERADKVSGIGEYGLILLGLAEDADENSNLDLSEPATEGDYRSLLDTKDESGPDDLAYLATFSQARVTDIDTVDDPTNPRYGLPESYQIEFETADSSSTKVVHYTRVIHIAEDLLENEVFGRPRLEPVYNRLKDLEKVLGGSAEMFWRGADRKFQLNYTGEGRVGDGDELEEQAEEMIHGLRNVMRTQNTEVNQLDGEAVDPSGIVEQELKHVAGTVGIPLRILTGSERGELASTQDRATFYELIDQRSEQFAEPQILRPVLDRLVTLGLLPEPSGGGYSVEWPDRFSLNELEKAQLEKETAQALKSAAPMGNPGQLATVPEIRENVFGWSPERGAEVSSPDGGESGADVPGDDGGGDVTDESDEDRAAFDEVLDDLDPDPEAQAALRGTAQADGGTVAATLDEWLELPVEACRRLVGNDEGVPPTDDLDALYSAYNDKRNMAVSDLERWENSTCFEDYASSSSGDPQAAVDRNKRLIRRSKDEWTADDRRDAVRMLSFHERHGAQDSDQSVSAECDISPSTAGQISWAFDPTGRFS